MLVFKLKLKHVDGGTLLKRMPLLNDFKSAGKNTRRFIDLKIEEIIFDCR